MGCSNIRPYEEGVEIPLEPRMEDVEINSINNMCSSVVSVLQDVEDIRSKVVDKRYEIYVLTGACSFIYPDMYVAIKCLYWRVATDTKGNIQNADILVYDEAPYFEIRGAVSAETLSACNLLIEYVNIIQELGPRVQKVKEKKNELAAIAFSHELEDYNNKIRNAFVDLPFKIPGLVAKFHKNIERIKLTHVMIGDIERELENTIADSKRGMKLIENEEEVTKINEIGIEANEKNMRDGFMISWPLVDERERFETPIKGFNFWNEKINRANERALKR